MPGLKEVTIRRKAFLCCLLMLALAGCGTQAAQPTPAKSDKHVVAAVTKLNPVLERGAGRLTAVITLLQRADAALQSAYSMQAIQLPESAQSSLSDANTNVLGARVVLRLGAIPHTYAAIARLLTNALSAYSLAGSYGVKSEGRSRAQELRGRTLMNQANGRLNGDPQASGPLAQAALQDALLQAARATAPRVVPRRIIVHRSRPRVLPTVQVAVRNTRVPVRAQHRRSSPASVGATAVASRTPTPAPAHLPTPAGSAVREASSHHASHSAIRSLRRPRSRAVPTSIPVVNQVTTVAVGVMNVHDAAARITRCGDYLKSLALGDDPLGSARILKCLSRASHSLRSVADGLTVMIEGTVPAHTDVHAQVARSAARAAITGLARAEVDVRSANVAGATSRLVATALLVEKTRKQLTLMRASRKAATRAPGH